MTSTEEVAKSGAKALTMMLDLASTSEILRTRFRNSKLSL
jgi:hypothetical protein